MSASIAPTPVGSAAPAPRWGIQASLIQPRQPAFWLLLALLGIGGYLFIDEQSIMSQLPTALMLSWGLCLLYAIPVFLIVYRLDLFEREPKLMLAAALLWGGVIATSLAVQANGAWLSVMGKTLPLDVSANWGAAVVGPAVEETLKLMGVITLYLIASNEFDGVLDGFVYGAMVGLGFTVVEDVSYFINATAAFGGGDATGPVIDTFLIRVVAGGLYGHVLFTGITGMGFAYFVTRRQSPFAQRLLGFGACVVAGVSAHVVWNSPWMQSILETTSGQPSTLQWIEYGTVKGLPFLILLGLLVVFATRSEEKSFRAIVASEPDPQVLTEAETASLGSLWSRRAARSAAGRLRGPQGTRLTGRLQAAQVEYAMIRSRTDLPTDPALEAQRVKIRGIRAQLVAVPFVPVPARPVVSVPAPVAAPVAPAAAAAAGAAQAAAESKPAHAGRAAKAAGAEPKPEPAAKAASEATAKPHPHAGPAPAAAASPPQAPAWAPTHLVPAGGMAAWDAPDPSRPAMVNLPERLELVVESRAGAWAQVRAVNGWRGWVDGRRLIDKG
jgi:RsiW-degrading membrane proteinase PrsW (M82 family)/septal ring-binding cell division protein DamX